MDEMFHIHVNRGSILLVKRYIKRESIIPLINRVVSGQKWIYLDTLQL